MKRVPNARTAGFARRSSPTVDCIPSQLPEVRADRVIEQRHVAVFQRDFG